MNPFAKLIVPLASDLLITRVHNDQIKKIYRGRITAEQDEINADNQTVQFSSIDYRGMLQFRVLNEAVVYATPVDRGVMTWALITYTQSKTNGNWGITQGVGATSGTLHTEELAIGMTVLEALSDLGHRETGGFEWDIDGDLKFNRYYPKRSGTGPSLDFGGNVTRIQRTLNPTSFGNRVVGTGSEETVPVISSAAALATAPQGLWEKYLAAGEIKKQTELSSKVIWARKQVEKIQPAYVVTLEPGYWDMNTMWLGFNVTLFIGAGRISEAVLCRIVEINGSIDESGVETIQLGLLPV
jgi:hypothetical protein